MDPEYIDYKRFCDEVESIFTTKHLEKMPLEEVEPFKPSVEWELNALSPEDNEKFMRCMAKIKEKVSGNKPGISVKYGKGGGEVTQTGIEREGVHSVHMHMCVCVCVCVYDCLACMCVYMCVSD